MKTKEELSQECVNVRLQALKGAEVFDGSGNLVTQNDKFKITYGSKEWENVMARARSFGYTAIKVLGVFDKTGTNPVEDNGLIQNEVNEAMKADDKPLTAEQKRIKELEARLERLEAPTSNNEKKADAIDTELLEKLRNQYFELFKKKPHHLLGVEKLQEAIDEKLNEK